MCKFGYTMSYQDIRLQNQAWSRMLSCKFSNIPNLGKGVTAHSTIDNNDSHKDTFTGAGTTRHLKSTLFQLTGM